MINWQKKFTKILKFRFQQMFQFTAFSLLCPLWHPKSTVHSNLLLKLRRSRLKLTPRRSKFRAIKCRCIAALHRRHYRFFLQTAGYFCNSCSSNPFTSPDYVSGRISDISTASYSSLNPLNAKLNPICHFLALLGTHHILHVRRLRVK